MQIYSPKEIEQLAKPIWEQLFNVLMAYKDTLSIEEIRAFGMPTVGDKTIDNQVANQMVDRYLCVNDMVEYYKKGIVFYVKKHSDTKEIYDIIDAYLKAWIFNLDQSINISGAPVEDLIALDRFACAIYDHAVNHITPEKYQSGFIKYTAANILSRSGSPHEPFLKDIPQKRESSTEFFSRRVYNSFNR